jgi:hypothetical protein
MNSPPLQRPGRQVLEVAIFANLPVRAKGATP